MNRYPADERWISDVEMGRCCSVTVPMVSERRPVPGEIILFALGHRRPGEAPQFVNGGDSVQVLLTDVVEVGSPDSSTGEPLFRISWSPLGRVPPPVPDSSRRRKPARPS
jgi:hypothetical protein